MLEWFEIFRSGEHTDSSGKSRSWSDSDLDKIVDSYNPQIHEAPIVVGHPETNSPAYGWIEKLKRVGDRLLAFPRNVVAEFSDAVRQGLFKKRSVSLYPDGTLRHVGFLGAAPPAVKGLKDLEFNAAEETTTIEFDTAQPDSVPVPSSTDTITDTVTDTATDTVTIVPTVPGPDTNTAQSLELKFTESEKQRIKVENELKAAHSQMRLMEFRTFLSSKTHEGIITPPQSEMLFSLAQKIETSDFSEIKKDVVSLIRDFVGSMQKQFTTEEVIKNKTSSAGIGTKSPAQIIAEEISRSNKN
ncbi:MAG: hypothetical protein HUU54_02575 [Ignavibacteriaceae bacterium]|nr:hypothetical protein [Ignavibacteriaceae bacterium]